MKFEITIEGARPAVSALARELSPLFPGIDLRPASRDHPGTAALWVVTDARGFDRKLRIVSRLIRAVELRLSVKTPLDIRTRNLAYSEPPSGSRILGEPFEPIPSLSIRLGKAGAGDQPDPHTVYLDPGHAFGTGKHPSTRLCLRIMHRMSTAGGIEPALGGARVLDFGCGTGLLAMAAVRLGARHVCGVDIDAPSARTAKENVARNGLGDRIDIRQGSWEQARGVYDLIVANLVTAALLRSTSHLPTRLRAGGAALVSGFGQQQAGDVERAFQGHGMRVSARWDLEGWAALVLTRPPPSPGRPSRASAGQGVHRPAVP